MPGWEIIGDDERQAVNEVFDNGGVLFRQAFAGVRNNMYKVKDFEAAFAQFTSARYAHAVTSGAAGFPTSISRTVSPMWSIDDDAIVIDECQGTRRQRCR